ncbi:electron transfer flavoprotein subunit alpha/FixB family protein [Psychrobacter sp. M13]|uniref:electron transfer flavoprotein subunit alpha/FixB family protein n=1 Tax=Psychrobacter sp. M13 TaxID=3067275 RepID=UPI00273A87D3|nr:FAD-binding protein [Psychrobacter sp. M13]WLP95121.1 FAD-binding protein [Psychrobacter sp. M13]
MAVLVYAEHDNASLKKATLNTIAAAKEIGGDIHVLVAGSGNQAVADEAAKVEGVTKVLVADNAVYEHQLAENIALLVADIAGDYSHILAPATTTGKGFMPRAAALLDVSMLSEITKVVDAQTFERPIYAGNATATVKTSEDKVVLTVRATAFDPAASEGGLATVEAIDNVQQSDKATFVSEEMAKSDRPELTSASIVVSGGRALANGENFTKYIEPLADKLGAAIGASRAAVDAGYVANDMQVGQTGKIIAPDLYIAAGISGAIQHLAGMKDSKVIVAINNDPDSPIASVADYFLEADLFDALPELTSKV